MHPILDDYLHQLTAAHQDMNAALRDEDGGLQDAANELALGIFDSGVSSEWTLNAAVRSVDGDWAIIYLSSRCHVRLNLDKIAARQVKATWVNPQTGEAKAAGSFATGNLIEGRVFPEGKKQWFTTPDFWEDAVLILDGV